MSTLAPGARIEIKDGVAHRHENGRIQTSEIKELPEGFVRWQLDYKRSVYSAIEKDALPLMGRTSTGEPVVLAREVRSWLRRPDPFGDMT